MEAPSGSATNATQSNSPSRKFYYQDICVLKSNALLFGTVERTFYDVDMHDPPQDTLIIAHVPAPEKELTEFLQTGVPSKGFVYVAWTDRSNGYSLVSEDDIELVDRYLDIGNLVKRNQNDTMSGTVVGISSKYTLRPIAYRQVDPRLGERGPVNFTKKQPKWLKQEFGTQQSETSKPPLLYDIEEDDIRNYHEYDCGNYILYRQKVGVIRWVSSDVVLMLPNQTAVIVDNQVFELPLETDFDKVVSMPPTKRLDPSPSGLYIPDVSYTPGDWVRPPSMTLKLGNWLFGSYSDKYSGGNIISTSPTEISVDWMCSNVFAVGIPLSGPVNEILKVSDLQNEAIIYDFFNAPAATSERGRYQPRGTRDIGDIVIFKDPAGAAVKYPQFDRIPSSETFGYDINVFTIVSVKTEAVVQWQDLSTTTEMSTSLHKPSGHEDEIMPGNLVALKEKIQAVSNPNVNKAEPLAYAVLPELNNSILRLNKVGVVQRVNSRERVACVRWFKDPHVDLLHGGNVLRPSSVLGEIGDETSEVSMYELAIYDGLHPLIQKEMVVLIPEMVHSTSLIDIAPDASSTAAGPCALSYLWPAAFTHVNIYLHHIKEVMVQTGWFQQNIKIDHSPLEYGHQNVRAETVYNLRRPLDWVGHIVGLNLDGSVTVRLGALAQCRDVRVPIERILIVLDEDSPQEEDYEDTGSVDDPFEELALMDEYTRTGFFEGIEPYMLSRGFPGDDDWTTDSDFGSTPEDDYEEDDYEEHDNDTIMEDAPPLVATPPSEIRDDPTTVDAATTTITMDTRNSNDNAPPNFVILDTMPPADHHFSDTTLVENNAFVLRRIAKEYKILESSLPAGIFARTWESRMDLLRVLIIGPEGTPYEYAPYIIDFHFGSNFPNQPPETFFHSWTNGMGRINPNLYEDGKICLSILGTWPSSNADENWVPEKSTVLQILVSIMGLVLVKDPFYNEAGFDAFASEGSTRVESIQYTEKVFVMTRTFIKQALERPVTGFEDILAWHYLPARTAEEERPRLLEKAISETRRMIDHFNLLSEKKDEVDVVPVSPFVTRLSLGAVVMLRKHLDALEKIHKAAEEAV